jgi:hypothetical protein
MEATLLAVLVPLTEKVIEMVENWNSKDYVPSSLDDLKSALEMLKSLPDLPQN